MFFQSDRYFALKVHYCRFENLPISSSSYVFILKQCVEDFTLKHLLIFEICAIEICEKFVYNYLETIEFVSLLFSLRFRKFTKFTSK